MLFKEVPNLLLEKEPIDAIQASIDVISDPKINSSWLQKSLLLLERLTAKVDCGLGK